MIAIIQARANSGRFLNKVFAEFDGASVIKHVLATVRSADGIDKVAIAVPMQEEGKWLREQPWARQSLCTTDAAEDDVLRRIVGVAEAFAPHSRYVIRICGDNPLIDRECLEFLVHSVKYRPRGVRWDYVGYHFDGHFAGFPVPDGFSVPAITRPTGYFAEACSVAALKALDAELPARHPWREHVTAGLYEQQDRYACGWLRVPSWYYLPRVEKFTAIDTPEDLERVERYVKTRRERSASENRVGSVKC